MGGGDHAEADGFAVVDFAVAAGCFDGVREGVSEVEVGADA